MIFTNFGIQCPMGCQGRSGNQAGERHSVWAITEECGYLEEVIFDLICDVSWRFSWILRPDRHHQKGWKGVSKEKPKCSYKHLQESVAGAVCARSVQASCQQGKSLSHQGLGALAKTTHTAIVCWTETWRAGSHLSITICTLFALLGCI